MKQYIYILRCPETGAVRYVGKCVNPKSRLRQHISESKTGLVRSHKCTWIRSLLKRGLRPVMDIDVEIRVGDDWKQIEIERIAHFRSQGCELTNATNGGDEAGELTDEGRRVLSERASAQFGTPEGRATQAALMKELCKSPEWRAARDAAAKATRSTPEYKQRMSERSKAKWAEPGYKEKCAAKRQQLNADPDFRARIAAGVKAYMNTPEAKAIAAKRLRDQWANPAFRAKMTAAIRQGRGLEA